MGPSPPHAVDSAARAGSYATALADTYPIDFVNQDGFLPDQLGAGRAGEVGNVVGNQHIETFSGLRYRDDYEKLRRGKHLARNDFRHVHPEMVVYPLNGIVRVFPAAVPVQALLRRNPSCGLVQRK